MASFFDLDIAFEDDPAPDLSKIPAAQLTAAIEQLPESLREVAQGILVEKRTFSDVSQDLGIRQGELVSRLHRAQLAIGMQLMSGGRPSVSRASSPSVFGSVSRPPRVRVASSDT